MRIIAILLNIAVLLFFAYMITKEGLPKEGKDLIFIFLFLLFTPLINLLYIFIRKEESWLTLYFKRKALEEKKKIEELINNK